MIFERVKYEAIIGTLVKIRKEIEEKKDEIPSSLLKRKIDQIGKIMHEVTVMVDLCKEEEKANPIPVQSREDKISIVKDLILSLQDNSPHLPGKESKQKTPRKKRIKKARSGRDLKGKRRKASPSTSPDEEEEPKPKKTRNSRSETERIIREISEQKKREGKKKAMQSKLPPKPTAVIEEEERQRKKRKSAEPSPSKKRKVRSLRRKESDLKEKKRRLAEELKLKEQERKKKEVDKKRREEEKRRKEAERKRKEEEEKRRKEEERKRKEEKRISSLSSSSPTTTKYKSFSNLKTHV